MLCNKSIDIVNNLILKCYHIIVIKAVASAAVFSDRLCIATGGAVAKNLSSEHLNTCCYRCGHGCDGGFPESAWYFFRRHGIVTGGDYDSGEVRCTGKFPILLQKNADNSCVFYNFLFFFLFRVASRTVFIRVVRGEIRVSTMTQIRPNVP